jgi:two-component system chemotaxis sensor kinase CheA
MPVDENTQIFITENYELLDDMESALLALERSPNDADLIDRVFRAAHTIKGSAGLFGFNRIINFTHGVENLLDDMRNCLVPITGDLISLFMKVKDHIELLIKCIVDDSEVCSGLIAPDTLIRDNNPQLLRCQNGTETNIQTIF